MVETIKYASVSIEEVIAAKLRLEANVFNVEARKAKEVLRSCKWETVHLWSDEGLVKTAFYPGRFRRIYVNKGEGYPMLLPSQMREMNPRATKFIAEKTFRQIGNLTVDKNTLLITRSGTIGNCTIVSRGLEGVTMSDDVIRVKFKNPFELGFVYTYLLTEVGRRILATNNYGSVIQHIEPEHLENVIIPKPSQTLQEKIHDLILHSFELRDNANDLSDKAEKILVKELQLQPIDELKPDFFDKKAEVRTFSVRLELLNNRFEGSYHNPLVSSILDCFLDSAESIKPLSNLSKEITMPGIFKRIYVDEENGVPFLGTNDILEINPRVEKFLSKVGHKKLIEKELSVKKNTILITDRGTIGNVVLVPEYYEKESWTVSQNSIRIVPNSNDIAGYIYIFLNSDYGKVLSKRETYGAVIDMIDPGNAGQIPIPILKNKDAMKKINDLALKANKLRTSAYYKEKEAIKIMNDEVIYVSEN
jgi:type I restriction enzyme, S subunit